MNETIVEEFLKRLRLDRRLGLKNARVDLECSIPKSMDTLRLGLEPLHFLRYCDPDNLSSEGVWDFLASKLYRMSNIRFVKIELIDSMIDEPWLEIDIMQIVSNWEKVK